MPKLHYPNSNISDQELRNVLPFLTLKVYDVSENASKERGVYRYGIFQISSKWSDYMKKNLYNDSPNDYDVIPREHTEYIEKLQAHLAKLEEHRKNVNYVVASLKETMDKLDPNGHANLIAALKQLIGEDRGDDESAREAAYNNITEPTMVELVKELGLNAKISYTSNEKTHQLHLDRMILSLLPQSISTSNLLDIGTTKYDNEYMEIIKNVTLMMGYYKSVKRTPKNSDGYVSLAESLDTTYYNLNDFSYYANIIQSDSLIYRRTGEDLKTIKPNYREIALLNTMNGVIVRFRVTEHEIVEDEDATSYTVKYVKTSKPDIIRSNEATMPAGMFRVPEKDKTTLKFLGGMTYGTTDLKYEKSERNEIVGPKNSPPLFGIDRFEFIGELGNVQYLFNIRAIYDRQSVTADIYGNSPYSLPDTVEGQPKSNDPALKNAYTGSMANYLAHSSKVMSRSRGKLYCIFYMQGHYPVAADENNIYELSEELYSRWSSTSNIAPRFFKSGETNKWHLPDGYTLNALNYILNISKIDLTDKFINEKGAAGTRSGSLHTSSTFLTASVIRPCDLFYRNESTGPHPSYNVKIIKSNIFPNLRLEKVVNHSKKQYDVNPGDEIITTYDDPLWPRFFSFNNVYNDSKRENILEVFDYERMSSIAYCNNNEYNVEILVGDSLHVDHVSARMHELSLTGKLTWNGYTTTLDQSQIPSFREYVSSNYGKYLYRCMMHPVHFPTEIVNKDFLIRQKRREICYAVYRAIASNRNSKHRVIDFNVLLDRYEPNNEYIGFDRVETIEREPMQKLRQRVYPPPKKEEKVLTRKEEILLPKNSAAPVAQLTKTFRFDLNMVGKAVKETNSDTNTSMWKITGVPSMKPDNNKVMAISRDLILNQEQREKYSRIIANMITIGSYSAAKRLEDPDKTDKVFDFSPVGEIPSEIHANVLLRVLKPDHRIPSKDESVFETQFSEMRSRYMNNLDKRQKAASVDNDDEYEDRSRRSIKKTAYAPITILPRSTLTTDKYLKIKPNLAKKEIEIVDEIDGKTSIIPLNHTMYEPIEKTVISERDDSYQYAFGWVDAPFVDLFLERIGAESLGFAFYEYTRNKDHELKDLGTLIHKVCQTPIPTSKLDSILSVLAFKKQGLEVRHEDTILHTSRAIEFIPFYDTMENISFKEPEVAAPAVVQEVVPVKATVAIVFSDDDDE